MGRISRRKKERRKRGVGPVARVAKGASRESLLALLEAASASPTACHRLSSLALIFDSVLKRARTGSKPSSIGLLPKLVRAAYREDPELWCREDFHPHDARFEVLVRYRERLYRMLPGSLDQPVAVVDNLRMVADLIDPVLVEHLGFGLGDGVELVLRRVDYVASVLAPTWSTRTENLQAPPSIQAQELEAAATLSSLSEQIDACRNPDRARRALQFLSKRPERLPFNPAGGAACFGAMIAVQENSDQYVPLPAGILVDSLSEMGGVLAERACQLDPDLERLWQYKMERGVAYMLAGSGHRVVRPAKSSEDGPDHWVVVYSPSQVIAVDVVAALRPSSLKERMEVGIESLDRIASGSNLIADVELPIPPHATVMTVQIIAHPEMAIALPSGDHAATNLRGFSWIVRTAARDPEDLWYFLRDLTNLNQKTDLFSGDMFDAWEVWRTWNKSFDVGSMPLASLLILYDGGESPWVSAAEAASAERALMTMGLPQLSAWPIFDNTGDSVYLGDRNLGYRNRGHFCQVLPWSVPVVISMVDFRDRSAESGTLWAFAEGIVWKLKHMKESFHAAADLCGLKALQIGFIREEERSLVPLRIAERVDSYIALGWNTGLLQALQDDSQAIEAFTGRLLSEAFGSPAAKQVFVFGWDQAPPGVRRDPLPFSANVPLLPQPETSHLSQIGAARQRLGKHLMSLSVNSGTYEGERAKRLETDVIYPWALQELHQTIKPYSAEGLLLLALSQLERTNCQKLLNRERIARQRGFPVRHTPEMDPPEDESTEIPLLAKAIALILEETLACPPEGDVPPDSLLWNEALSIAQMAFASCLRSELLHYDLKRTGIVIDERFRIHIDESDEPTIIDGASYEEQRAAAMLPEPVPINTPGASNPEVIPHDSRPIREMRPELAEIDDGLQDDLGFGLDALTGVLVVASDWGVTPEKPFAVTTLEDFADVAVDRIPGVTLEECRQAIEWLTLRAEDLRTDVQEYWETERRVARVDTRPFVERDQSLYILPWTSASALRVLLSYLEDGRLPWPRPPSSGKAQADGLFLGKKTIQALDKYRQRKNDQLEKDGYELLSDTPLVTRRNIKPHKADRILGIDWLSGEIDLLAVDNTLSRIWVIEVKDPHISVSVRQTRKAFDRFHNPDGHVDKLLQKVKDIKRGSSTVTGTLGIERPDREWSVHSLMVTRKCSCGGIRSQQPGPFLHHRKPQGNHPRELTPTPETYGGQYPRRTSEGFIYRGGGGSHTYRPAPNPVPGDSLQGFPNCGVPPLRIVVSS